MSFILYPPTGWMYHTIRQWDIAFFCWFPRSTWQCKGTNERRHSVPPTGKNTITNSKSAEVNEISSWILVVLFLYVLSTWMYVLICCRVDIEGWSRWSECFSSTNDMEDSCCGCTLWRGERWHRLQSEGFERWGTWEAHTCLYAKDPWSDWNTYWCSCSWHGHKLTGMYPDLILGFIYHSFLSFNTYLNVILILMLTMLFLIVKT